MILPLTAFIVAGNASLNMTNELLKKAHDWYEISAIAVVSHVAIVLGIRIIYNQFELGGFRGLSEIFRDFLLFIFTLIFFPYILSTVLEVSGSLIDLYDPNIHIYTEEEIKAAVQASDSFLTISLQFVITLLSNYLIEFSKFTFSYLILICYGIGPIIIYLSTMSRLTGTLKAFFGVLCIAVLWPILVKMSGHVIVTLSTMNDSGLNLLSFQGASMFFIYSLSMFFSPAILWLITGGGNPFHATREISSGIGRGAMASRRLPSQVRSGYGAAKNKVIGLLGSK